MACATPLVVSRAGAIPEVVGPDGECADLVTPGDVGELEAALAGAARRPRAPRADGSPPAASGSQELFSWRAVAADGRRGVRGRDRRLPGLDRLDNGEHRC